MTIGDLKAVIQADTGVPPEGQSLFFNTVQLQDDSKTLDQYQIRSEAMLGLLVPPALGGLDEGSEGRSAGTTTGRSTDVRRRAVMPDAETLRLQALEDTRLFESLRYHNPELAEAINDPARFQQIWEFAVRYQKNIEAEKHRELAILNADPFNVETQKKIEEIIRQERVMENVQNAMNYAPEVFGRVHMLYIPVEVNNHSAKAFVDSGAQATIMSPACAEACGIMRLIDKRYAGIARGVGTANVLGRVHWAQIKIGTLFLPCSFTVMEGKEVDLLLGLDMLKRHQAIIDLNKNALVIRGEDVPFLPEAECPKEDPRLANEPTISGPAGMKTGAISGAVSKTSDPGEGSSSQQSRILPSVSSSLIKPEQQPISPHPNPPTATEPETNTQPVETQFPSADIATLVEMGLSREQAIQSLEAAGGNVLVAASMFFN